MSNVVLKLLYDARDVCGLIFEEVYLPLLLFLTVDPEAYKREGLALYLLFVLLLDHLLYVLLLFLLIEGLVVPNVGDHALWEGVHSVNEPRDCIIFCLELKA